MPTMTIFIMTQGEQIFMPHPPVEQVLPSSDLGVLGDVFITSPI